MSRECTDCHQFKDPETEFHSYRPKVCKKCHSKQSIASKKKRAAKVDLSELRRCIKCDTEKPNREFYATSPSSYCKKCHDKFTIACAKNRAEKAKEAILENKRLKEAHERQQADLIDSLKEQIRLLKLNQEQQ